MSRNPEAKVAHRKSGERLDWSRRQMSGTLMMVVSLLVFCVSESGHFPLGVYCGETSSRGDSLTHEQHAGRVFWPIPLQEGQNTDTKANNSLGSKFPSL